MKNGSAAKSPGEQLAARLSRAQKSASRALSPGVHHVPVIHGLSPNGVFSAPLQNVIQKVQQMLVESKRVFSYGRAIVFECVDSQEKALVNLMEEQALDQAAPALLANIFICEMVKEAPEGEEPKRLQFGPPRKLVDLVLHNTGARRALPRIRTYAKRPVFDDNFILRGPGWHPEPGILVHGPAVEPLVPEQVDPDKPPLERLPRHLSILLRDFCFRSAADLVNALAFLLTGLLITVFLVTGKALALLDGNQPSVGKTLFARMVGIVLDGADPHLTRYSTDDEEMSKSICATLRTSPQSILIIDNAKTASGVPIDSAAIEQNSVARQVSLRILGKSRNFVRPNDFLWAVTANGTRASRDIIARSVPIRFHFEGDPKKREFADRDPLTYAAEHRIAILGELAGMVIRWNQSRRPESSRPHRLARWAKVVGGILEVCGYPEFLQNQDEAENEFNTILEQLAALAEATVQSCSQAFSQNGNTKPEGLKAAGWEPAFRKAGILDEEFERSKGARPRATRIGAFLSQNVGRAVPIDVNGQSGTATLCVRSERSNSKVYFFQFTKDADLSQLPEDAEVPITHGDEVSRESSDSHSETQIDGPKVAVAEPTVHRPMTGNDEEWN